MANGLFKGNATYFGRKSGTLEDVVEKINKANPKPEVFDIKEQGAEYKKVFDAAMKKFKINSPADLKSDEEKKKFFDYVDSKYKAKDEQMDDKAQKANQSQMSKDGEEESKAKKSVRETVQDLLLKSWKQAAQMAEEKHKEKKEEKVTCPKCEGKGCEHCEGKGYHMKEMTDAQKKLPPALQKAIKKKEGK